MVFFFIVFEPGEDNINNLLFFERVNIHQLSLVVNFIIMEKNLKIGIFMSC